MFEKLLLEAEKKGFLFRVFFITFLIVLALASVNYFIGGNALFLVAFVSLALSYPVIQYIRTMNKEEISYGLPASDLLRRHERELLIFWSIFVAAVIGFYVVSPLMTDVTYQEAFVNNMTGLATGFNLSFGTILFNNLVVLFFTFILSFLAFSGLIFVLIWNASIVAYYLYSLNSHQIAFMTAAALLVHGLLEIGGFVLGGIAGALLAYNIDARNLLSRRMEAVIMRDLAILIGGAIFLIVLGAIVEVL